MDVSAERIEPHADAAQTASSGKRKLPDQDTTSPARPRTVMGDHMMKQETIALALANIRSFTEMGLDTATLKRDLQALSAVGEPEAAAGPREKVTLKGALEKMKASGQPVKVGGLPKEPVGGVRVEEEGGAALGEVSELGAGVGAAGPLGGIEAVLPGKHAHAGAAVGMTPEFRAWGGPAGEVQGHPPPLSRSEKKLFAAVVLINQLTQDAPDLKGAVAHKICFLSAPEDDVGKPGATPGTPGVAAARAVIPATEDTSPAGQMWRKGELVAEGVPTEDVFSVIAAAAENEESFYGSRKGLMKALNNLDSLHMLVKNGWLSQWEIVYAKKFHENITKDTRKAFYFADANYLCCCKSRVINKTQVRTAARDAQAGEVWECRSVRAARAFACLGLPLEPEDAGIMLEGMIETLDASFRFLMPGLCKEVWDLPRYLGPGEAPLPAPVAEAAVEPGAEDGQINKDAQGVAGGASLEGGGGQADGAVGAAVAIPLPAVASAAVAIPAVASAAVAIPAVAIAADGLPTSASLA
ncbi:hypothetical protein T484DRAFT_1745239 [Baffinella frigidus]|nr:hypothetical protein T484DRAFT_1745239 [Cryptophyta sp. CCMP2293]